MLHSPLLFWVEMFKSHRYIKNINVHNDQLLDLVAFDHIGGFDKDLNNDLLCILDQQSGKIIVRSEYIFNDFIKKKYSNIDFVLDIKTHDNLLNQLLDYKIHPTIKFGNFLCSFNGTPHVSRQLLTAILNNQKMFDPLYSSKNFSYSNKHVIGHLDYMDLSSDEIQIYSKYFKNTDEFSTSVYSFGHDRYDHKKNIYKLEHKLTKSFLHLVSDTMATSYYPFYGEKFLYSIVTRGLFISYAHPEWHKHLVKYYGFKLYNKIFDYDFDVIQNPVKRLIRLMEMISKFSTLSTDDWRDLYLMEQDSIEHNYDHYFSGSYLKRLARFE